MCNKKFQASLVFRFLRHTNTYRFTAIRGYADSEELTVNKAFKCYNLADDPPNSVSVSREEALEIYKHMHVCRRFETEAGNLYKSKKVRGFCHLYTGQEAIAVGMKTAMRSIDSVITSYRCHAWTYLMGVSNYQMLTELLGLSTGCSRGKGGSMHMYAKNFYGGNGIVGAQVPMGAGIALAHKYRNDGGVCFTLYGDGAANQGQVFESFNISCLWKLPIVFVCENNIYGMGTKMDRSSCCTDYYTRGHYIPGLWVDANHVLAVRSATEYAIEYCLKHGPIVLEMSTYRFVGHSMSDPGTSYRSREEIQEARKQRDPIINFQNQIIEMGLANEDELKEIQKKVKANIDADMKKAMADKEVELHELTADVYAVNYEPKIRNITGYTLNHETVTKFKEEAAKPTPSKEIKDVPLGDAALKKKAGDKGGDVDDVDGKAKAGKPTEGKEAKDANKPKGVGGDKEKKANSAADKKPAATKGKEDKKPQTTATATATKPDANLKSKPANTPKPGAPAPAAAVPAKPQDMKKT